MIFKLWHKLALTFFGITGIILILALYISDQSVKKGFLAYINQVESNRLNGLVSNLTNGYQKENNWDFIRDNRRVWRQYTSQSTPPRHRRRGNTQGALPPLRELAQREGESRRRPPPPPRGEGQVPNSSSQETRTNGESRSDRRPPPHRANRGPRPPRNVVLLDQNKQYVMSSGRSSSKPKSVFLKEIKSGNSVVGYLQFERFTQFTDELDMQFIEHQHDAFLKIALLALSIILLGAALLAAYLRSRINKIGDHASLLSSGDYSPQNIDPSKDELGQLSRKLDFLGKTLEDNRLSRRRWVSDISHELRTPVAVLQGEIEAIQDGIRSMSKESIGSLHNETLRLSRLISDLHQLSSSDIGALNYVKAPLDIVALVKGILANRQHKFDAKNITVNVTSSDDVLMVSADSQRLEQLFSNLANNSEFYTQESGELSVNISSSGDEIKVEWFDSEPGVSDEQLGKLFDRLYRVEESRNRNAGGAGLGLSICKNIVEAHDATISAEHSPLGGILFSIHFKALNS